MRARGEFAGCPSGESFEIFRDGRSVFESRAAGLTDDFFELADKPEVSRWLEMGRDVTGDGRPDLVVLGTHGNSGSGAFIFEIGDACRLVAHLDLLAGGSEEAFKDFDDDGLPEIVVVDGSYWEIDGPEFRKPMPEVIWKSHGDRYEPASELMREPPLDETEFDAAVRDYRRALAPEGHFLMHEQDLASLVLARIYSGNAAQGWRLFDLAWPAGDSRKAEVRESLAREARRSGYWECCAS